MEKSNEKKLKQLELECDKKDKMIKALTQRVEKLLNHNSGSFGQFRESILLTKTVNERTKKLNNANKKLENSRSRLNKQFKELQLAQQKLAASLSYNETLINSLQDCLLVLTAEGTIVRGNKRFEIQFNLNHSEYHGKELTSVLKTKNEDQLKFHTEFQNLINERHIDSLELEFSTSGPTNQFSHFLLNSFDFVTDGDKREVILTLRDISAMKELERKMEVEKAKSLSNAKLASLGEMAGGIAHEINNPLSIISTNMHCLKKMMEKDKLSPAFLSNSIEEINETVKRITNIIKGLRNISRNTEDEAWDTCNLHEVLNDVLPLCAERFKQNDINFCLDIPKIFDHQVLSVKRLQLSQVLLNLLTNAFDEVSRSKTFDKWIRIKASTNKNMLILKIIDSGKGISKDIQDKIFQPFYTTKDIGKGTGLGLSLSHSLIQKQNGKLYIDNDLPNTCFTIEIPAIEEEQLVCQREADEL